jgi:Tol biopolymer transport system component/tRNA A-37 threonylcarbamoyl transferase component Bud32
VLEVIGGGGMGLVYKAEDLKLGRRVALKFLPRELASDLVALQRFEREAQTASALNHPNICTIYEIEEHEGKPFIVMELLEGETLRDRLAAPESKALALDQLLNIAMQICDGLKAAHQKGIIHRDIKPANIFLTDSGQVKILDFGLAKLLVADEKEQAAAMAATQTATDLTGTERRAAALGIGLQSMTPAEGTLTQAGVAMGTAGYMSPEQVRGEKLEARSDVFSFGLVLYEMATGQRAFTGETVGEVCEAILHNTPAPVRELNSKLPGKLVTTIDKCLEKERGQRYQSASEVRVDLDKVQKDAESKSARRARAAWAAAVVVLAALAIGMYLRRSSHAGPGASPSLEVRALTESGKAVRAAATPDGRYVAYVKRDAGKEELRLLQVAADRDVQLLPSSPLAINSVHFSPDGNFIYFLRVLDPSKDPDALGVFRIATLGGPAKPVAIDARMNSVTVSPDGKQIAYISETATASLLVAVDPDGARRRVLATRPAAFGFSFVEWSPSEDTLAAVAFGKKQDMGLVRVELPGGTITDLSVSGWNAIGQPAWSPDGAEIFAPAVPLSSSIMQIWAFDSHTGAHRALTSSSTPYFPWSLSATSTGDLIANTLSTETTLLATNRSTEPHKIPALRGEGWDSAVWIDDRILTSDGNEMMVVHDADGGNPTKLRSYSNIYARLGRCGRGQVVYWALDANYRSHIARTDITTGLTSALTEGPNEDEPACTADGSVLVFRRCADQGNRCFLMRKSLDGGQPLALYEFDPLKESSGSPTFSPDGKDVLFSRQLHGGDSDDWAAIISDSGGHIKELKMPATAGEVAAFKWSADGKSILYARNENGVGNIWSVAIDGKAPRKITNFDSEQILAFDVSPDNRLVISRGHQVNDVVLLKNVK